MKHKGVSLRGNIRAIYIAVKNKGKVTQGGSTITQQLVKNVFLSNKRTLSRKIEEIIIALKIEYKYSKKDIIEFYLNNIYFGNGAFGVESASEKYFSKPALKLTLSEEAFLTAIPNNPVVYDPINHKDKTIERRNSILKYMLDQKYVDDEQYEEAVKDKINLNISKPRPIHDDYTTSLAIDNSVKSLMEADGFIFKYQFSTNDEKKEYQKKYRETYSDYDKKLRNSGLLHT